MDRNIKKAVAIAAVMNYIHEEGAHGQHQMVAISAPMYRQLMHLYEQLHQFFSGR